jgi:ketosteroid isomerase-like protein
MNKTTGAVLGDIYDAWRAQDLDWLGSYLPEDFCHVVHIPTEIHVLGGECRGKNAVLKRLGVIADDFDFLRFDTSDLLIKNGRAGVEIPIRYLHRESGAELATTIVNFWTLEDGWPIMLSEYHDIGRIQSFVSEVATRMAVPRA